MVVELSHTELHLVVLGLSSGLQQDVYTGDDKRTVRDLLTKLSELDKEVDDDTARVD